jgi:hypothetical protein
MRMVGRRTWGVPNGLVGSIVSRQERGLNGIVSVEKDDWLPAALVLGNREKSRRCTVRAPGGLIEDGGHSRECAASLADTAGDGVMAGF